MSLRTRAALPAGDRLCKGCERNWVCGLNGDFLLVADRVCQQDKRGFGRAVAHRLAAEVAEVELTHLGRAALALDGDEDVAGLIVLVLTLAGEAGDRAGEAGAGAGQGAAYHGLGHGRADGAPRFDQREVHAEQLALGRIAVGHEAALETAAQPLDVGQQRGEQAAAAALGRGDGQAGALGLVQEGRRLLGQPIGRVGKIVAHRADNDVRGPGVPGPSRRCAQPGARPPPGRG